ncbi:MAG: hypothetical protein ACK4F0_08735, partial [Candidatus Ratteibacteria bacterium]
MKLKQWILKNCFAQSLVKIDDSYIKNLINTIYERHKENYNEKLAIKESGFDILIDKNNIENLIPTLPDEIKNKIINEIFPLISKADKLIKSYASPEEISKVNDDFFKCYLEISKYKPLSKFTNLLISLRNIERKMSIFTSEFDTDTPQIAKRYAEQITESKIMPEVRR